MSKITIDLEDLKSYIKSLPTDMEEWYNEEWVLYAEGIHAYVKTVDLKFADTFKCFMNKYGEEVEAKEKEQVRESFERLIAPRIGEAPVKTEDGLWRY